MRFWSKVQTGLASECWPWEGGRTGNGYGAFHVAPGKQSAAHRFSYALAFGEPPKGMVVRHKCDNPICVNPRHLIAGTTADNMRDRDERGRGKPWPVSAERRPRGERHGRAKVTEDTVKEIRRSYSEKEASQSQLATKHGLTQCVVGRIVNRKLWRHVA